MDTPTLLEGQLQSSCLDQNDHGAPAVTEKFGGGGDLASK